MNPRDHADKITEAAEAAYWKEYHSAPRRDAEEHDEGVSEALQAVVHTILTEVIATLRSADPLGGSTYAASADLLATYYGVTEAHYGQLQALSDRHAAEALQLAIRHQKEREAFDEDIRSQYGAY